MHNRVGSGLMKLLDLFPSFISPVLFSFTFVIQPLHCFIDLIVYVVCRSQCDYNHTITYASLPFQSQC